jgi:uncharacterized protein YdcH (DUF465 family)
MTDHFIKEILIEKNDEFRRLYLKHQRYEQELLDLYSKRVKTQDDLLWEQNLKKKKLQIKDAMQELIIRYRRQAV